MNKIFISHSSKDKEIVNIFVDTILTCGLGFNNNEIFCTSIEGLGIKTGEDWRNEINKNLRSASIIILFITPNYKESEICLNEMGASWATEALVIPIIVPPIKFETIGVIYNVKQAICLTSEIGLDDLKDRLEEFISGEKTKTARWTTKKKEAIIAIEAKIASSPFEDPLSRDVFNNIKKELSETKESLNDIVKEKMQLSTLCKKLENLKNKKDIETIKKELGLNNEYDDFIKCSNELGSKINNFSAVIRTIIFNNFTGKNMELSENIRRTYNSELKEAFAQDIIDEEEELNRNHPQINSLYKSWEQYEKLFNTIKEETFMLIQDKHPDIILDVKNLNFWQEILCVHNILF